MFPQAHFYFAHRVLGRKNDAVVLGCIFPDMAIGAGVDRNRSHSSGFEILEFLKDDEVLLDFALANITHGVNPDGLDYYSDERIPPHEKGYCFEKARTLVDATIETCNIPPEMGWWKAHNIVEMGVELIISSLGDYGNLMRQAFKNKDLIENISQKMGSFYCLDSKPFVERITNFPKVVDLSKSTPESLAEKYDCQMKYRHGIHINIPKTAKLIYQASEMVKDDLEDFFALAARKVQSHVSSHVKG